MVKVRDDQPTLADGRLDLAGSVDVFCLLDGTIDRQRVIEAGTYLRGLPHGESLLSVGLAFGVLIAELELGKGLRKFGCPLDVMTEWIASVSP